MKKIIILENNGGQLANQLWQYANLYAYALEKNCPLENYAFFRYRPYFNFPEVSQPLVKIIFNKLHLWHHNIKLSKLLYLGLTFGYRSFLKNKILSSQEVFYLEPSRNSVPAQQEVLKRISAADETYYFCGWNFRNPEGLIKYHSALVDYFQLREAYRRPVAEFIGSLRKKYRRLIGVHIRQGDYRTWRDGQYYFSPAAVRTILDGFLKKQARPKEIVFVLCSDEAIDDRVFQGLNYVKGLNKPILDLYTLAATDLIIGSTSTFGQWAAYYGGLEMINFSRDESFWEKYSADRPEPNPWLIYQTND